MPYSATFELLPQTPVFNAGAVRDARELLRAPSVKGLLRWWFRAALGAACPLHQLRRLETSYFGSQDQAGDLRLDLSGPLPTSRYPLKPYDKTETRWNQLPGFRYLAYGLEGRPFYDPVSHPTVRLSMRCDRRDTWETAWCSLWLLSHLGGLGSRVRRGMGAFWLRPDPTVLSPADLPPLQLPGWRTADELAADLTDGLNRVAKCLARHAGLAVPRFLVRNNPQAATVPPTGAPPLFSCFAPGFWRARIAELVGRDWEAALNALGGLYQSWRHPPAPGKPRPFSKDFKVASSYVRSGSASDSRLAAFGLPLLFSFRSGTHAGARVGVRKRGRPAAEDSRRASPMFLRVLRTTDGKFFALAHVFKCELVGAPDELEFYMKAATASGARQDPSAPFPVNWAEVDGFINSLKGPEIYVC